VQCFSDEHLEQRYSLLDGTEVLPVGERVHVLRGALVADDVTLLPDHPPGNEVVPVAGERTCIRQGILNDEWNHLAQEWHFSVVMIDPAALVLPVAAGERVHVHPVEWHSWGVWLVPLSHRLLE